MQIVVCKPLNTIKGYRPLGKAFSFIGGNADIFDDVILLPKLPEIWATEARAYNRKSEVIVPLDFFFFLSRPCEKISVNSTTVIKNDIASGLKNSRSDFFTVYNGYCNLSRFFGYQPAGMECSGMESG